MTRFLSALAQRGTVYFIPVKINDFKTMNYGQNEFDYITETSVQSI